MIINPRVIEILREYRVGVDDGLCYLLALHFRLNPLMIPDIVKNKVHTTKIVESDRTGLRWNIPLFQGQETAFEWVGIEYIPMFEAKNYSKGGKLRESTVRMKRFFSTHPDVRKDEVIGATRMYLQNTEAGYIRFPHYFIEKGRGVEKVSDLEDWIRKFRIAQEQEKGRSSGSITMK